MLRNDDTLTYSLSFDTESEINYLIKNKIDTCFFGIVSKAGSQFLLYRHLPNNQFAIHAIAYTDSTITGLETEWLQSILIREEIGLNTKRSDKSDSTNVTNPATSSKKYGKMIQDTTHTTNLETTLRQTKRLFKKILALLPPEKIISPKNQENIHRNNPLTASSTEEENAPKIITKIYPNPFNDLLNLTLKTSFTGHIYVYTLHGKQVYDAPVSNLTWQGNLSQLKSGNYLLKIMDKHNIQADYSLIVKN